MSEGCCIPNKNRIHSVKTWARLRFIISVGAGGGCEGTITRICNTSANHVDNHVQYLVNDDPGIIYVDVGNGLVSLRVVIEVKQLLGDSSNGRHITGETPGLVLSRFAESITTLSRYHHHGVGIFCLPIHVGHVSPKQFKSAQFRFVEDHFVGQAEIFEKKQNRTIRNSFYKNLLLTYKDICSAPL